MCHTLSNKGKKAAEQKHPTHLLPPNRDMNNKREKKMEKLCHCESTKGRLE